MTYNIGFPIVGDNSDPVSEIVIVEPRRDEKSRLGWFGFPETYEVMDLPDAGAKRILQVIKEDEHLFWKSYQFHYYHSSDVVLDRAVSRWSGHSDTLACLLAMLLGHSPYDKNLPKLLVSCECNFSGGHGLKGLEIKPVSTESGNNRVNALESKWRAATNVSGVHALILHQEDAEILEEKIGIKLVNLEKGTLEQKHDSVQLISVKSDQMQLLVDELGIKRSFADIDAPKDSSKSAIESWLTEKGFSRIELVGHGGIGVVLKAWVNHAERFVALKYLAPEHWGNERLQKRFVKGYQAITMLQESFVTSGSTDSPSSAPSANFVKPNGWVCREGPCLCYSMELVEGLDLNRYISDTPSMNRDERLQLFSDIARSVSFAHKRKILHRDLHPGNILIRKGGRQVTLTDFDMARLPDASVSLENHPADGYILYLPPEALEPIKSPRQDEPSYDIFQLGRLLHYIITGQKPNAHDWANPHAYLDDLINKGISEGLARIVMNCVSRQASKRYPTIDALLDDLQKVGEGYNSGNEYLPLLIDKTWRPESEKQRLLNQMQVMKIIGAVFAAIPFLAIIALLLVMLSGFARPSYAQANLTTLYMYILFWAIISIENFITIFLGPEDVNTLIDAGYKLDKGKLVLIGVEHIFAVLFRFVAPFWAVITGDIGEALVLLCILELFHAFMWVFDYAMAKPSAYIDPETREAKAIMEYYNYSHSIRIALIAVLFVGVWSMYEWRFVGAWFAIISIGVLYLVHEISLFYYRGLRDKKAML